MSQHRLLVLAIAAFLGSAGIGTSAVLVFGAFRPPAYQPKDRAEDLAHLRDLATGDIGALLAETDSFLMQLDTNFATESQLWKGAARIAEQVVSIPRMPSRKIRARTLVVIATAHNRNEYEEHMEELRKAADMPATKNGSSPTGPSAASLARIAWAQNMFANGTDTDIMDSLPGLLGIVHEANGINADDSVLWDGVARAAKIVISEQRLPERESKAKAIALILNLRPDDPTAKDLRMRLLAIIGIQPLAQQPHVGRLNRALELAEPSTSIEVLLDNQFFLVSVIHECEVLGDQQHKLWEAVARICTEVCSNSTVRMRGTRAVVLLDVLKRQYPRDLGFDNFIPKLRSLAR